jgi:RNA polymerase sigma-70 factor (ECF subfamily)
VRAIAIRCAIDIVRRRRPEYALSDSAAAAEDEEARHEDVDLLRAALESLPPLDREIMIAREIDGVSDRIIAERFDMSVTAVRVRMHRARRRIRARFEEVRP